MGTKKEPPNELDPLDHQQAEIDRQKQVLAADAAEDRHLGAVVQSAVATYQVAYAAHSAGINDPAINAATSDTQLAATAQALLAAADAKGKAEADLAAHQAKCGDMAKRWQELADAEPRLRQARMRAAHAAIVKEKLPLLLQLENLEKQEADLLRNALATYPESTPDAVIEKAAGLVSTMFPAGIFRPCETPQGKKSVWLDDVLPTIGLAYPQCLPADRAAEVLEKNETRRMRGAVIPIAGRVGWHTIGNWHLGDPPTAHEFTRVALNFLRGPIRHDLHGI